MKTTTISCLYHQMEVNFLLNPFNSNIMINATQMAKIFDRRIDLFLKSDGTKSYIELLKTLPKDEKLWNEFPPKGGNSADEFSPNGGSSKVELLKDEDIIQTKGQNGTFMHRLLAIEFASWLDPAFKLWVNITIDNILFGNYKKHWEAHTLQEEAKERMLLLKEQMLTNPTAEMVLEYFEQEKIINATNSEKRKAIKDQIHLFNYLQENN